MVAALPIGRYLRGCLWTESNELLIRTLESVLYIDSGVFHCLLTLYTYRWVVIATCTILNRLQSVQKRTIGKGQKLRRQGSWLTGPPPPPDGGLATLPCPHLWEGDWGDSSPGGTGCRSAKLWWLPGEVFAISEIERSVLIPKLISFIFDLLYHYNYIYNIIYYT